MVASCHSECVGKIFSHAGAKHVICIDKKYALRDEAAVLFSRTFYSTIFCSTVSICKAYESAMKLVERKFGKFEANKFMILLDHDASKCKKNLFFRSID